MLLAQFHVRTISGFGVSRDESSTNGYNVSTLIPISNTGYLSIQFAPKRNSKFDITGGRKPMIVSCKSDSPFDSGRSTNIPDDHDFLPASLLLSETAIHSRMRKKGFEEETRWSLPGRWNPFRAVTRQSGHGSCFAGLEFLRRFESPTIFLKASCDGEFAVEKLLDTFGSKNDQGEDCQDQFQLARNLVERLGYKVNMVKISHRAVNTYFGRVLLSKPGDNEILSIDARPSDAISMAYRCQAPIHVSKRIVLKDGIRINYGLKTRYI